MRNDSNNRREKNHPHDQQGPKYRLLMLCCLRVHTIGTPFLLRGRRKQTNPVLRIRLLESGQSHQKSVRQKQKYGIRHSRRNNPLALADPRRTKHRARAQQNCDPTTCNSRKPRSSETPGHEMSRLTRGYPASRSETAPSCLYARGFSPGKPVNLPEKCRQTRPCGHHLQNGPVAPLTCALHKSHLRISAEKKPRATAVQYSPPAAATVPAV